MCVCVRACVCVCVCVCVSAVTELEDVCGLSVRSRLFHQADVMLFSNFQRKTGRLPDTSGNDNLRLGIRETPPSSQSCFYSNFLSKPVFPNLFSTVAHFW